MMELIQQNMLLKKERRRQPVLTESTGVSVPEGLKSGFEQMSGLSFEDVRIHYSSPNPARIGAYAYTAGKNVYLGPGQEKHLPHELAHVMQQKQGRVRPTVSRYGLKMNDSASLEREADLLGNAALQEKREGGQPGTQKSTWWNPLVQMCPKPGDAHPPHDSEDILESFCSDDDMEDHHNISTVRMDGRRATRHVSNDASRIVRPAKRRKDLVDDAKAIHRVLDGRPFSGNTTVVCAVFQVKGSFLHIAMVNDTLMTPTMRERAQELGYTILRGIKTHAEANMILYAHKHQKDARLIAFGCDKDTCPECAKLLRECTAENLEYPTRPLLADGTEDFSPTYYFRSASKNPVGVGPFVARMQSVIDRDYEAGKRRDTTSIEIIGCTKSSQGEIVYIVRKKSGAIQHVPSQLAKMKYQKEVLAYLESRGTF